MLLLQILEGRSRVTRLTYSLLHNHVQSLGEENQLKFVSLINFESMGKNPCAFYLRVILNNLSEKSIKEVPDILGITL